MGGEGHVNGETRKERPHVLWVRSLGPPPLHLSLRPLALKAQPVMAPVPGFLLDFKFFLQFPLHSPRDQSNLRM